MDRRSGAGKREEPARRVGYTGLLISLGLVLQIFESALPPLLPIPGAKLGLANLATVIALFYLGPLEALEVTVMRTLLGGMLRGSLVGLLLSTGGGAAAWCVMTALYLFLPAAFSVTGLSVAGAAAHNTAQLFLAVLLVGFAGLWRYLPYLLLVAVPTGCFIGAVAGRLGRTLVPGGGFRGAGAA